MGGNRSCRTARPSHVPSRDQREIDEASRNNGYQEHQTRGYAPSCGAQRHRSAGRDGAGVPGYGSEPPWGSGREVAKRASSSKPLRRLRAHKERSGERVRAGPARGRGAGLAGRCGGRGTFARGELACSRLVPHLLAHGAALRLVLPGRRRPAVHPPDRRRRGWHVPHLLSREVERRGRAADGELAARGGRAALRALGRRAHQAGPSAFCICADAIRKRDIAALLALLRACTPPQQQGHGAAGCT